MLGEEENWIDLFNHWWQFSALLLRGPFSVTEVLFLSQGSRFCHRLCLCQRYKGSVIEIRCLSQVSVTGFLFLSQEAVSVTGFLSQEARFCHRVLF